MTTSGMLRSRRPTVYAKSPPLPSGSETLMTSHRDVGSIMSSSVAAAYDGNPRVTEHVDGRRNSRGCAQTGQVARRSAGGGGGRCAVAHAVHEQLRDAARLLLRHRHVAGHADTGECADEVARVDVAADATRFGRGRHQDRKSVV